MSIAAMKQALDALEAYGSHTSNCDYLMLLTSMPPQRKPCSCGLANAITALRAAIEQAEKQEPVAWADTDVFGEDQGLSWTPGHFHKTPLYTAPRQWHGLTDEEIDELALDENGLPNSHIEFARAIEAKLKEKNT